MKRYSERWRFATGIHVNPCVSRLQKQVASGIMHTKACGGQGFGDGFLLQGTPHDQVDEVMYQDFEVRLVNEGYKACGGTYLCVQAWSEACTMPPVTVPFKTFGFRQPEKRLRGAKCTMG